MKRLLFVSGSVGLAWLAVVPAYAGLIFATNPQGSWSDANRIATVGTPFTVGSSAVSILALGYFDSTGSGLTDEHTVGIYSLSHTLLGSVLVPSGIAAIGYHDGTRWEPLGTPIALAAHTDYMLAFTVKASGDPQSIDSASQVTLDSHCSLADSGYAFTLGSAMAYPAIPVSGAYSFGGNMELEAVPEPGSWAMMATMLAGVAGFVVRLRRAKPT